MISDIQNVKLLSKNLENIYLGYSMINDEALNIVSKNLKKLNIMLLFRTSITSQGIIEFSQKCNLETLASEKNYYINFNDLIKNANLKNLKHLILFNINITEEDIILLSEKCQNLIYIYLHCNITDKNIIILKEKFKRLTKFNKINDTVTMEDESIK